jgi:hypothetical protein
MPLNVRNVMENTVGSCQRRNLQPSCLTIEEHYIINPEQIVETEIEQNDNEAIVLEEIMRETTCPNDYRYM